MFSCSIHLWLKINAFLCFEYSLSKCSIENTKQHLHRINIIEDIKAEIIACLMFDLVSVEALLITQLGTISKELFYLSPFSLWYTTIILWCVNISFAMFWRMLSAKNLFYHLISIHGTSIWDATKNAKAIKPEGTDIIFSDSYCPYVTLKFISKSPTKRHIYG